MATLGLAVTHSNILPSGLATWKVKWGIGETPDEAYYSFGPLADGSVVITGLASPGEYGEQHIYGFNLEASAKILCTDKTTVLELLHNLIATQLSHKITAINAKTIYGNFGTKWRFDSSADYNGNRFVQIDANHHFLTSHASVEDLGNVIGTPASDGTADAGDTLYTWSAATKFPAGISAITINPSGDAETIGRFRNAKLICESIGGTDEKGRYLHSMIRCTLDVDMLQTDEELAYLGANFPSITEVAATLADGTVFTMSTNMRVVPKYNLAGGAETQSFSGLTATQVIKPSQWAGIIT